MSRKKKHGAKKPPLSALDKTIYWAVIWFGIGLAILIWAGLGLWIPRAIGFPKVGAVACGENWWGLSSFPLAMLVGFSIPWIAALGLDHKQPIFGNKKAKASVLSPMLTVYPLVSGEFWQNLSKKAKKKMLIIGMILVVLFVICSVLLFLGFYPRSVLYEDMHMERYDITNQMTDIRHLDAADSITIAIERHSGGGRPHRTYYDLHLRASFGEELYGFETDEFAKMSDADALRFLISVKERYGSRINIAGADMAQKLIHGKKWGSAEKALLYELFELK